MEFNETFLFASGRSNFIRIIVELKFLYRIPPKSTKYYFKLLDLCETFKYHTMQFARFSSYR